MSLLCMLERAYVKQHLLYWLCMFKMFRANMMMNDIKRLIDQQGITRYQFWKTTGLNRETAYRLYEDSAYIPGAEVMEKIARTYGWQPGMYVFYVPSNLAS